jgi:hypothetical protein
VTLRDARAACLIAATSRSLKLRDRAEDNLNALLDFRSAARRRASRRARPAVDAGDPLPA